MADEIQESKKNSHLAEHGSGGAHFATSARLAMNQELIDLNSFDEKYGDRTAKLGNHTIKENDSMYCPPEYFCCVHTPVNNWRNIEEARKALDKEKTKLEERGAWDLSKARPQREVEDDARRIGEDYHFENECFYAISKAHNYVRNSKAIKAESCIAETTRVIKMETK
jgi:hypothetical protein